jgi:PAS domain-containing protein
MLVNTHALTFLPNQEENMTAINMIREGFGIWADGVLSVNLYATPIVFTLLFLFGFLATAVLKTFRVPRAVVTDMPGNLSDSGREIIDDANTARLFELESEIATSKDTLKRFTETLSTTFAHLSGGLAIFDADKSLYLFNPALSDLLDLDPVWLAKRPSIADFISMLREKRHLPEKRNFLEWRRLLTDLKDTGQQKSYDDEWVLPDGRVFRVTGQPHPRGAVAFLFEDISTQVAIERQHRQEMSMSQSILNGMPDAVAVVSASGMVSVTNEALSDLFGA